LDDFQSLQFWIVGLFSSNEWVCNDAIEITDSSIGIDF
jgi:hypothetical protein